MRIAAVALLALLLQACASTPPPLSQDPQCEAESTLAGVLAGIKWNIRSKDWDQARKDRNWALMARTLYQTQSEPRLAEGPFRDLVEQVHDLDLTSSFKDEMLAYSSVVAAQCELRREGRISWPLAKVKAQLLTCQPQHIVASTQACLKKVLTAD